MNKLLALSVALLSVSLYGADKKSPNQIDVKDALIRELNAQNRQLQIERNVFKRKFDVLTKKMEIESELWQRRLAAAGKAERSRTGLEGFAKDGIEVRGEYYSKDDKTFSKDKKAIENQVELRLRQSGIKRNKDAKNYLIINAQLIGPVGKVDGHTLTIEARRMMTFEANGKTYEKVAPVWRKSGIALTGDLREDINTYMDPFLLAYLKANPKKEKE